VCSVACRTRVYDIVHLTRRLRSRRRLLLLFPFCFPESTVAFAQPPTNGRTSSRADPLPPPLPSPPRRPEELNFRAPYYITAANVAVNSP